MKLLLDQHLSHKLVDRLSSTFPGSSHVRLVRLEKATDSDVWLYAKWHEYAVVTKDQDLVDLAVLRGAPPKIVWLRLGNVSTREIETALVANRSAIEELARDPARTVLEIVA